MLQIPRYIITLHELLAHTPHNHVERKSLDNARMQLEDLSRQMHDEVGCSLLVIQLMTNSNWQYTIVSCSVAWDSLHIAPESLRVATSILRGAGCDVRRCVAGERDREHPEELGHRAHDRGGLRHPAGRQPDVCASG